MKAKKALRSFMAVALTVMMVAVPSSVVRAEEAQNTYTVEKGDCLCRIAKKYMEMRKRGHQFMMRTQERLERIIFCMWGRFS